VTFNLLTLHLGDVLMALPAMRAGDSCIAREQHRVSGVPVAWLDAGLGIAPRDLHMRHQADAWLAATGREPMRHVLLPPVERSGIVIAPAVRDTGRHWGGWDALFEALPAALVVTAHWSRKAWVQALNAAHTVICPDTGTAHMADALGVPKVVALHGQGQKHFERYAPYWNREHCIVRDSMQDIAVDDVLAVIHG
jgi:hypothetical protein